MFFYPEPEPIGYCMTDVSPSYLTDGVFFNGRIGPTHKCVAKQLSAIPRGPNDPVAPRVQVSPRTLEKWCVQSKAMHVDNCGRNAKALHGMMGLLPKENVDPYAGWKSKVALFPRSEQYEYSYIREKRIKAFKIDEDDDNKRCTEVETDPMSRTYTVLIPAYRKHVELGSVRVYRYSAVTPAFEYTKPPIWWKDKVPIRVQCAVGHPDDYEFRQPDSDNNPGENEMEEDRDRVDPSVKGQGHDLKELGICDCSLYYNTHKSLSCNAEVGVDEDVKEKKNKSEVYPVEEHDPRWHQVGLINEPRHNEERKKLLSNIKRPYLHDINTWYSENKPTKLIPSFISGGKKPILEWHFSNL